MDGMTVVFRALADPTRQRLLDRLRAENGQPLGALCRDLALTRQGVTQHLAVLEAAGLVTTVRRGREKLHYLNPVPLHEIADRWIARFERPDLAALGGLKRSLEQETDPMDVLTRPRLVFVTYLATTPERVWDALTDPDQTAVYWRHRNVSGWAKGDHWTLEQLEGAVRDRVGTILEVDPPRRLVHSWASPADADNPARHSRVTFDIEPAGDVVRLTLVHEDLPADEAEDAGRGWALVLAGLKTYLETGGAMPWPDR